MLDAMANEDMNGNAMWVGHDILGPGLVELIEKHKLIGDVRGIGLFSALKFVSNRSKELPFLLRLSPNMKADLQTRGLLVFKVENRIHVVPPCIVSADQVVSDLKILDDAIRKYSERYSA